MAAIKPERILEIVEPLSGGMKRRLTIARSLISRPEILLLDEPTTGLDPQARHVLWDRLFRLRRSGVTLVLTTHYMDEAEQLCDRLVVMDRGAVVEVGPHDALMEQQGAYWRLYQAQLRQADEEASEGAMSERMAMQVAPAPHAAHPAGLQ